MSKESRERADRLDDLLARARSRVDQLTPDEARRQAGQGARIVDVRESWEMVQGTVPDALHIERGMLELEIGSEVPDTGQPLIMMCAGGERSALSALVLKELGYQEVFNLAGGFNAWREHGLPVVRPKQLDESVRARYLRHLSIAEVGESGQRRLLESRVFITGAGGLGSPAALYLAAAGVGRLTLVDDDVVERSNLQRQILHSDHLVGQPKTWSAVERIRALNPEVEVDAIETRLTNDNADKLLEGHDVVLDGSDNFPTRYALNDACVRLGLPLVYGAVLRFSGQVGVFKAGDGVEPCYRCLFPEPPLPEDSPSCAEAGVLGVMPGVIGTLQAAETLKLLLGIGEPLISRLLQYDALSATFRSTRLVRDPECRCCALRNL